MSSSPFEIFRRNLKPLMVLLTLLALFSFVVLPALDSYLRQGGGINTDPVAAKYDGIELTRGRVARTTQNHAAVVRFLSELAQTTMEKGGMPQTPGFQYDEQNGQIRSLGIDVNPGEEATINTLRFYSEAKKAGFELDDTAVKNWLARFTDGTMTDDEVIALLMRSTGNQLGQQHLYEQLRMHLLADLYQRGSLVGLTNGQMPVVTPLGQWQNFLKTNQQATVDAYGVLVSEYLDQTNDKPSESEIKEVYEQGKNRINYPNDLSPEPKFQRPDSAKIEYVAADLNQFVEAEKAKLTEEQLRAEYERRLAGGDFQLPDDATTEDTKPEETTEPEVSTAPEETSKPAEEDSSMNTAESGVRLVAAFQDEDGGEEVAEKTVEEATEKAAEEVKPESKNDEPKQEPEKKAEPKKENPPQEEKPAQEEPAAEMKEEAPKSESTETKETPKKETEPAKKEEPAKESPAKEEPKKDEPKKEEPAADKPAEKMTASEKPPAEEPPAEKPAAEKPAAEMKPDTAPTSGDDLDLDDEPAPTKPQTFEEVRDQIATDLATEPARLALDRAVTEATKRMRRYFSERAVHESNVSVGVQTEADAPEPLDLKAMAEELGLKYGQTDGLVNRVSAADTEPGSSFGLGQNFNRRGPPFSAMMFGAQMQDGSMIPPQALYSPLRTVDLEAGVSYVSWKTEDVLAYVPELDEVRDEVIQVIRTREARTLAKAAAEKIAEEAAAEGKTLADVIPQEKKDNLIAGVGPFSWLEQVGFMQTIVANVPELDAVGERFMREVFTSEVGTYSVAPNDPESVFYVVKPTEFQPDMATLQEQFRQPQQRFMAQLLGNDDARNIVRGFYESVDERTGFKMNLAENE
ncbi:hypothetical protein [Neorhodopirellula pilleata]|uniref:Periplasmic folding chaperone n=1 Tax=Neorhodopirellula pilleata TaxID=2714738 RepID=A0A5C6A336_9BACT|nr:hypothetical protein [Neorhodopirellula pilleata]TWT93601.1 hypothetical protein Pla100_41190 [Neorhodopirellula pilleata]